ncbi:hypothetical protein [uncultured Pseudokineococcus sp.]|uniref:hypothetical protein n=1 Tax=uncultured Pseudokineococcus sp. TaxID=1642928 RepID=UPI002602500D|nr:hypothetical protein [uncultured Pseudokineococcus sp.]
MTPVSSRLRRTDAGLATAVVLASLAPVSALAAAGPSSGAPAAGAARPGSPACGAPADLGVEDARLDLALPGQESSVAAQVLAASGLDRPVARFGRTLCRVGPSGSDAASASSAVAGLAGRAGADLWRLAVDRAQAPPAAGIARRSGDRTDDRGLYWARIAMRVALQEWAAASPGRDAEPALAALERTSRGLDDARFPAGEGATRVLVSGFDPFQLDAEPRRSNPSGAAALALDGTRVQTPDGPAVVQAVVLPVTWGGFDDGVVEDAYGPHLVRSERDADVVMTISQGSPGIFSVEEWAGAWRGGYPDNARASAREEIPLAPRWPQPDPSEPAQQFIRTTLPAPQMLAAGTGPFPVELRERISAWTGGTREGAPVTTTEDPQPGWLAAAGGGGDYLSNESMYRANRLRLAMGRDDVLGGHLHTPTLVYPWEGAEISNAAFEAHRRAVVDQVVALTGAAARAAAADVRSGA